MEGDTVTFFVLIAFVPTPGITVIVPFVGLH